MQFDRKHKHRTKQEDRAFASGRELYLCNDRVYVIARRGDTYESIGRDLDMRAGKLRKYNEVGDDYVLQEGDIVYLKKKQKHVAKALRYTFHKVQPGESMYSISQRYCIRLERLYKYNYLSPDYAAQVGDLIYLR